MECSADELALGIFDSALLQVPKSDEGLWRSPPKAGPGEGACRSMGWEQGTGNQMHLRAKFDIQILVQLGMESAAVPKALAWTGITPTTSRADTKSSTGECKKA